MCQKCVKTHLQAFIAISKNFPGFYARTPANKRRDRGKRGGVGVGGAGIGELGREGIGKGGEGIGEGGGREGEERGEVGDGRGKL
jgi:hypothetical protein